MKKSALVLILSLTALLLFSCKKAEKTINLTEEFNDKMPYEDYTRFANYTDYLAIPDFLTDYQADIYKKAAILHYIFICAPSELEKIPLLEEQEKLDFYASDLIARNGATYNKSTGRYRNYADFEELCLSVFTREFFEKINKNKRFIKEAEDLYISAETEVVQMSLAYAPWHEADEFELIKAGETEIKFNATGHYFENPENNGGEITKLTVEIILTRTDTGWRFSQFATAGNPYIINNKFKE